jgi:DNA-binding NtrC family response regulator
MENRILVVDDDRDVCGVLTRNLRNEGYNASFSNTGYGGIEEVKNGNYDLVFLDLKLPDMDGAEVLKRIRSFNKDIVVVVLTGYPSLDTAIETLKCHASDYILKPFKVSHLKHVIEKELLKKSVKEEFGIMEITDIGPKIKELRKKNKISLDVLAEKTNLSKSFLSEVERKKKFPRLSTLQSIARNLGVNVYLFFK